MDRIGGITMVLEKKSQFLVILYECCSYVPNVTLFLFKTQIIDHGHQPSFDPFTIVTLANSQSLDFNRRYKEYIS